MYNKGVKAKRVLLLASIIFIFILCFSYMNIGFDRLSRYPYENENDRRLIDMYLDDSEIEYIIEYSIAPIQFISYIEYDAFNIYHIDYYNDISSRYWYLSNEQVVNFTEELLQYENGIDTALDLARDYYYSEVLEWLSHGDIYNPGSTIINNPESARAYLDDELTMSTRIPYDLVELNLGTFGQSFLLKSNVAEHYEQLCADLANEYGGESGGLIIEEAYVSYDEQVELFESMQSEHPDDYLSYVDYPGHSEHQLGLAIDISFYGYANIEEAPQYEWLLEHAHEYGFVQTYTANTQVATNKYPRLNHFRYVGIDLANEMHSSNLSLKEAIR